MINSNTEWQPNADGHHWLHNYTPEIRGQADHYDDDLTAWHWSIARFMHGQWTNVLIGVADTREEAMSHADKLGGWYESEFQRNGQHILVDASG